MFGLGVPFCLLAEWIFVDRLLARINLHRPPDQQLQRRFGDPRPLGPRPTPFQLFREYRQLYGNDDLPRVCAFWLIGAMVLLSASVILDWVR